MVFGDMWGIELGKDLDFLLNILNLVFCALKIDDLDGHGLLGALVVAREDEKTVERVGHEGDQKCGV